MSAIAAAACAGTEPGAEPRPMLFLDDVSILFPLPAVGERDRLLGVDDVGRGGPLLPEAVLDLAPPVVESAGEELREELRVVSVRIDPCVLRVRAACTPHVRFVMQPIADDLGEVFARDGALHLFYALEEAELVALIDGIAALDRSAYSEDTPLGVHPAMQSEGLDGPFATALRALLLQHAGAANLRRMTFMRSQGLNGAQWVFGGFEDVTTDPRPMIIPEVETSTQTFDNILVFSEEDYVGGVRPKPSPVDDISLLYNSNLARAATEADVIAAARAALRIENPALHDDETIDCVSCHVATGGRLWTERNFDFDPSAEPDRYRADLPLDLTSRTTTVTASLRAFGWFADRPSISQRTVNETAAIVSAWNAAR